MKIDSHDIHYIVLWKSNNKLTLCGIKAVVGFPSSSIPQPCPHLLTHLIPPLKLLLMILISCCFHRRSKFSKLSKLSIIRTKPVLPIQFDRQQRTMLSLAQPCRTVKMVYLLAMKYMLTTRISHQHKRTFSLNGFRHKLGAYPFWLGFIDFFTGSARYSTITQCDC